jgi:FSR family fosmidomycin resistance protein-like MFS transporter
VKGTARAALAVACGAHFLHDGFSDTVYILLPIWTAEFSLSFAEVGFLRTLYSGGMAIFQIPAGLLAERLGERRVLALGTAATAAGFVIAGWAGGSVSLGLVLLAAGLGSGVQHPLSSTIVSKAFETGARRAALGTYNFSGDLGKVALPAMVAFGTTVIGWRASAGIFGLLGLFAAVVIAILLTRLSVGHAELLPAATGGGSAGWGIRDTRGFQALSAIGMIDNATRTPFLTFLPFLLIAKGMTMAGVGGAFALLFAGGAAGKFACGLLAERVGVIRAVVLTEAATAIGIFTVVLAPLGVALTVLPLLGIALNGTSSVLYGTVADLVVPERRARAYGLYYTLSVGCSALAPSLYGLVSDSLGVPMTLAIVGTVVLVTIPLSLALRSAVTAGAHA